MKIYVYLIKICIFFVLILHTISLSAQVERTFVVGVGRTNLLDTYLSPLTYKGQSVSMTLMTERQAHWGKEKVTVMGRYDFSGAMTQNQAKNAKMWNAQVNLAGGWHYNIYNVCHVEGLRIAVGGLMELATGGTYHTANGNNPAQGRLAVDLALSAIASYDFKVQDKPWQVRFQADIPLVGAMFSPQFGQSYYELFSLGHYNKNVRATWLGNAPTYRFLTTLAIPVRKSQLIIGYKADVLQTQVNGLKRHAWENEFIIGFRRGIHITNNK